MIESETGMKPRFHRYDIEVLVFMRLETGETELRHVLECDDSETEMIVQFQLQTPDIPQVAESETVILNYDS